MGPGFRTRDSSSCRTESEGTAVSPFVLSSGTGLSPKPGHVRTISFWSLTLSLSFSLVRPSEGLSPCLSQGDPEDLQLWHVQFCLLSLVHVSVSLLPVFCHKPGFCLFKTNWTNCLSAAADRLYLLHRNCFSVWIFSPSQLPVRPLSSLVLCPHVCSEGT